MWENNRLLLCFCVACGVVASYTLSVYLLIFVIILCVYLYIFHYKSFELGGLAATRNLTFSAPLWIKNITTSLMNSYHLSKPLEPEQNPRRDSPFAANLHISRRGSCRSSPFTCLDENVDYANRRNGMGVVSQSSTPKNSFSDNIREIRRRSNYELSNSSKIESFTSPHMSPCARNTSFNSSEITNVRRVQTVAGPLLGSPGISKRRANDYGLYVDACSPGLASRVVQYREESASPSSSVWTHQPQYSSPGQFPMVHLSHSPSTLPVLSPLNSQKASRRSVRVKIAPPDPLGSRLFPLSSKNNSSVLTQTDQSTKSVIETLKEISRKRIHSQLEDNDDDAAKRQKRSGPSEIQASNCTSEGENISKRTREESPRQQEVSPTLQPAKRIRNNEILSSLSSSRKLLQSGGIKRKTQNLDWSRCSTPILGKQQKTTSYDSESSRLKSDISSRISLVANKLASTLNAPGEALEKSNLKDSKILKEKEKKNRSSSLSNNVSAKATPEASSDNALVSHKKSKKELSSPIEDSPWQKDSPFVTVASPDDVIDDISALEEKREQDRRSRLLSMMTVISGGEPPVKLEATEISKSDTQVIQPSISFASSLVSTVTSVTNIANNNNNDNSENGPVVGIPGWNSKINSEGSTVEKSSIPPTQGSEPSSSTTAISSTPSLGSIIATNPLSSNITFGFGTSSPSAAGATSIFNTSTQVSSPTVSSQPVVSSSSESPSLNSSQQLPVPGSSEPSPVLGSSLVFGNKPTISSEQPTSSHSETNSSVSVAATSATNGTTLFSFGTQQNNQGAFGIVTSPTSSASPQAVTSTIPSAVTPAPASSTSTTSMFQIHPQANELGKENTTSTSMGFSIPVSSLAPNPVQPSLFSKNGIASSNKSVSNNILQGASTGVVFGAVANTGSNSLVANTASAAAPLSFSVASPVSTAAPSAPLPQIGLFSFGSSTRQISQTSKPINSGISASFGQPATSVSSTTQNQIPGALADSPKVGGFKFDLTAGKPLFTPNATPTTTANIFGAPGATNSEQKPFTFGSSKPLENPFASNTANSSTQQISTPTNLFGSATTKAADSGMVKENIFSFGSNSTAPIFSAPQSTSFPAQTATTSSSTGFSFPSASSGFSVQTPQSSAGVGFSLAATTAPSSSVFSTPKTSSSPAGAAFSFGSSPAFAPAQQSNLFAFGSNPKTQPETQQGSLFSFGSPPSSAAAGGGGVFGQPSASVAPVQTQPASSSAPSSAFQFGSPPSTQQIPGAFNFGAPNASQPVGGSFSMNAGGFSAAAPAMFSIGSGSTAPRARSSRSRRAK